MNVFLVPSRLPHTGNRRFDYPRDGSFGKSTQSEAVRALRAAGGSEAGRLALLSHTCTEWPAAISAPSPSRHTWYTS